MTTRPSTAAPILAVLAIVLVTLGAYVGGYFWLGEYWTTQNYIYAVSPATEIRIHRGFRSRWQAILFTPMGGLERLIKGRTVVVHAGEFGPGTVIPTAPTIQQEWNGVFDFRKPGQR